MAAALHQCPIEGFQADENAPHPGDGVLPEIGARTVRGDPASRIRSRRSPCGRRKPLLGRLGDDRRHCGEPLGERGAADASDLLVADRGHETVAPETGADRLGAASMIAARLAFMS